MKTLTLTLDKEIEKGLRNLAAKQGGRSVSSVVREALAGYLAGADPAKPKAPKPGKKN